MVPWNPANARIPSEVCSLPLGERGRCPDGFGASRIEIAAAIHYGKQFSVSHSLPGRPTQTRGQACDLLNQPRIQHRVESPFDPAADDHSRVDPDGRERPNRSVRPYRLGFVGGGTFARRCTGEAKNLYGPQHSSRVCQVNDISCLRVGRQEFAPQFAVGGNLEFGSEFQVGWWEVKRINQRAEVQALSRRQSRRPVQCIGLAKKGGPGRLEVRNGVLLGGVGNIDHPIPKSAPRCRIRLRRSNIHTDEHLHRVDREDLGSQSLCDQLGQLRLACSRGPENGDDAQSRVPSR